MFGLSVPTDLFQGSTERTWNCVLHLIRSIWSKLLHIKHSTMPRSRKRHHSHSRSKSRTHSRDQSHEREEKHKKNDSRDKDREGKRRKIESFDSPHHKRSVSSTPEPQDIENGVSSQLKDTPEMSAIEKPVDAEQREIDDQNKSELDGKETVTSDDKDSKATTSVEVDTDKDIEDVIVLDESEDKIEQSKEGSIIIKKHQLEITPKKVLSPKQIQKKLESEKKRQQRQKEKEEKYMKKQEERERIKQEKLKKKEEKQKELDQKRKEKEEKEEQKRKEREEKEQKRKEREEQKRKEREQEKLKKQQEIEEKNKEKQKEEELKQKTAAAFVNFFVPRKSDTLQDEKKPKVAQSLAFMEFEVKSDMKLPAARRSPLSETEKEVLDQYIENQNEAMSYIKDLKSGKQIGRSTKTWPYEETEDNDVAIVEDDGNLGETICEDKSKVQKLRAKFLKFHENRRPAYFGTWRKKSASIKPRKPLGVDDKVFNYEEDSDDDWEEEEQGESLKGSDDEEKDNDDEKDDYEVDNEFFVPHGHLSDDEIDDEESARLSPDSLKRKLKLLKDEFEMCMKLKTHKLKPRSIGCIWYNKDGSNVDEAFHRYLKPLAVMTNGQVQIKKREEIFSNDSTKKSKLLKELTPEQTALFLKVIHGNSNKKRVLIDEFVTYMANNGISVDISKAALLKNLNCLATWRKCMGSNKYCWIVNEDVEKKYNVNLTLSDNVEGK